MGGKGGKKRGWWGRGNVRGVVEVLGGGLSERVVLRGWKEGLWGIVSGCEKCGMGDGGNFGIKIN